MKRLIFALILLGLAVGGLFLWRQPASQAAAEASLLPLLTEEDTAGFARATVPNDIVFPRDLGPHPDYQTEWWYYTGNLEGENGRLFGYQFTIFRRALSAGELWGDCAEQGSRGAEEQGGSSPALLPPCPLASTWRTNQVYLAHFTVSDVANDAFYPHERFSRGAAGLAGAQAAPYRVWLEDWSVEEVAPGQVRLLAQAADVGLDLTLTQTLPPILHGDGGLSPKGPEPGNASYYYSLVRQQTAGTVRVGDELVPVTGLSWKDHEYSTSALSPGAVGWDWFSLQFDDGTALMFFQIRRADGTLERFSSGTFIAADGQTTHLDRADWQLDVTESWTSPTSGATYPAGWQIRIPAIGLEIAGEPLMANQELNVSTVYWEGAVEFSGTRSGEAVRARGYIEMTGYAGSMEGRL
ncbi:MAG: hypothetical protein KC425_00165 [Anaerolineales bacterium]|nr:hypothetical protein [Anaerolineales bacterium]